MDSVRASELPPDLVRSLPLGRRVLLVSEILAIYCRVRVRLLRDRFPVALAGVRELPGVREISGTSNQEQGARMPPGSAVTYLRAARLGRAVQRTLRLVPGDARCLMQSLVLTAVLARRGIDTKLLIGVSPGEEFEAHAWVEYSGRALLPDSQGIYHVLAEL
jgi:Transglutaminase-like superfamily